MAANLARVCILAPPKFDISANRVASLQVLPSSTAHSPLPDYSPTHTRDGLHPQLGEPIALNPGKSLYSTSQASSWSWLCWSSTLSLVAHSFDQWVDHWFDYPLLHGFGQYCLDHSFDQSTVPPTLITPGTLPSPVIPADSILTVYRKLPQHAP
jgi:hypothetical protein